MQNHILELHWHCKNIWQISKFQPYLYNPFSEFICPVSNTRSLVFFFTWAFTGRSGSAGDELAERLEQDLAEQTGRLLIYLVGHIRGAHSVLATSSSYKIYAKVSHLLYFMLSFLKTISLT
jgi:hypothetical protein